MNITRQKKAVRLGGVREVRCRLAANQERNARFAAEDAALMIRDRLCKGAFDNLLHAERMIARVTIERYHGGPCGVHLSTLKKDIKGLREEFKRACARKERK